MASERNSRSAYYFIISFLALAFTSFAFAFPTEADLDKLWAARQPIQGQKQIIKFIKVQENIPDNFEVSWRVARLVYFVGHFGYGKENFTKKEKLLVFKYGSDAANIARKSKPDRVEGHYWYATNLGSYGMVKGIFSALKYADEARDALIKAVELEPSYHWAGPYRTLGRFYQAAPRVISFGSKKKASECFQKALEISPDFRLNIMNLAVFTKEQGDFDGAYTLMQQAKKSPKLDGDIEEKKYLTELAKDIKTLKEEEA